MTHPDDRDDDEDESADLSDDPVLSKLDRDLGAVLRFTDNRLLVVLGAALAAVYLPDWLHLPAAVAQALYWGVGVLIIGAIVFTIRSAIVGKRKVAARYGLVCPACGHRPGTNDILSTAELGQCASCGGPLNVRVP